MTERCQHHSLPQPQRIQRLQGILVRRRADHRSPRHQHHRPCQPHQLSQRDQVPRQSRQDPDHRPRHRRTLPRSHQRTIPQPRIHQAPPRSQDRIHTYPWHWRQSHPRIARQLRIHKHHPRARTGRHLRRLPHSRQPQPREPAGNGYGYRQG